MTLDYLQQRFEQHNGEKLFFSRNNAILVITERVPNSQISATPVFSSSYCSISPSVQAPDSFTASTRIEKDSKKVSNSRQGIINNKSRDIGKDMSLKFASGSDLGETSIAGSAKIQEEGLNRFVDSWKDYTESKTEGAKTEEEASQKILGLFRDQEGTRPKSSEVLPKQEEATSRTTQSLDPEESLDETQEKQFSDYQFGIEKLNLIHERLIEDCQRETMEEFDEIARELQEARERSLKRFERLNKYIALSGSQVKDLFQYD